MFLNDAYFFNIKWCLSSTLCSSDPVHRTAAHIRHCSAADCLLCTHWPLPQRLPLFLRRTVRSAAPRTLPPLTPTPRPPQSESRSPSSIAPSLIQNDYVECYGNIADRNPSEEGITIGSDFPSGKVPIGSRMMKENTVQMSAQTVHTGRLQAEFAADSLVLRGRVSRSVFCLAS